MKILVASFLFIHSFVFAGADSSISELLRLAPQNCFSEELYQDAIFADGECSLCTECKESITNAPLATQGPQDLKRVQLQNANDLMFQQLKKIIASNLQILTTARSLKPTGSQYNSMISSCNLNQLSSDISACLPSDNNQTEVRSRLSELESQVQREILNQILPGPVGEGILFRSTQAQGCGYSESQTSATINEALELGLSKLVPKILDCALDGEKFAKSCFNTHEFELVENIRKHPLLKNFSDPSDLKNFLLPLANVSSSKHRERLNGLIYNNQMGNILDRNLSRTCIEAFTTFKKTICEINQPNVNVNLGLDLLKTAEHTEFWNSASHDSSSQSLEVISYCPSSSSDAYDINSSFQALTSSIPRAEAEATYDSFSNLFEKIYIAAPRELICSTDSSSCEPLNPNYSLLKCEIYSIKNEPSAIDRIKTAKDPSLNRVLESFIGSSSVEKETKVHLVREGILPQENGLYVAPEAQASQFASGEGNNGTGTPNRTASTSSEKTSTSQFAEAQSEQNQRRRQQASSALPFNPISSPEFSSSFTDQINDLSDLTNRERQRFAEFEREISRRISQSPNGSPTRQQVQQVAHSVVRERGASLAPLRQQQLVNSYVGAYDDVQDSFRPGPGFANSGGVNLGDDLAGPSQAYRNEQNAKQAMAESQRARTSGGIASAAGGGNASLAGTNGRSPASAVENEGSSLSVRISLDELQDNPQRALSQLPASLPDTFILEIQGAREVYRYQVLKSGAQYQVSQVLGSNGGQSLIARLERLLRERLPERRAQLPSLIDTVSGAN